MVFEALITPCHKNLLNMLYFAFIKTLFVL